MSNRAEAWSSVIQSTVQPLRPSLLSSASSTRFQKRRSSFAMRMGTPACTRACRFFERHTLSGVLFFALNAMAEHSAARLGATSPSRQIESRAAAPRHHDYRAELILPKQVHSDAGCSVLAGGVSADLSASSEHAEMATRPIKTASSLSAFMVKSLFLPAQPRTLKANAHGDLKEKLRPFTPSRA